MTAAYGGDTNFSAVSTSITEMVTPPAVSCDLNGDGAVNIIDVQRIVNEALGLLQAADDLDHDGRISIVDVQIEIGAALGWACTN